jgi:hypothetical protein
MLTAQPLKYLKACLKNHSPTKKSPPFRFTIMHCVLHASCMDDVSEVKDLFNPVLAM